MLVFVFENWLLLYSLFFFAAPQCVKVLSFFFFLAILCIFNVCIHLSVYDKCLEVLIIFLNLIIIVVGLSSYSGEPSIPDGF